MNKNITPIPIKEQYQGQWYHMRLKFKIDLELSEINRIMHDCGADETLISKDIGTITMDQTVSFIPDEQILYEYETAIQKNYFKNNPNLSIHACRFIGYEYLYPIKITEHKNC